MYEGDVADSLYPLSIIGHVYKVAPPHVNDGDSLRVIDEEGEDYLYPADYFEPYKSSEDQDAAMISVHLSGYLKNILRAEALAANKSVSDGVNILTRHPTNPLVAARYTVPLRGWLTARLFF